MLERSALSPSPLPVSSPHISDGVGINLCQTPPLLTETTAEFAGVAETAHMQSVWERLLFYRRGNSTQVLVRGFGTNWWGSFRAIAFASEKGFQNKVLLTII